jgi:hypothetical protein
MVTLNECPVCGSDRILQYHQSGTSPHISFEIMPQVTVEAAIITRYWVCQDCNVIFQNPRMSERELDKFYSQGVYRKTLNLTDKQMDDDEAYRARIDVGIIRQYIDRPQAHLDIGSSRGYLLDLVDAPVKVGVESNLNYNRVTDVTVYQDMGQVLHKSFDLVTAIHVLEHVSTPLDFLQQMAVFVNKKGYLVVEVPTWKSPGGPLRLAHLYHFVPDVLKQLCQRAGLRVEDIQFTPHLMVICRLHHK